LIDKKDLIKLVVAQIPKNSYYYLEKNGTFELCKFDFSKKDWEDYAKSLTRKYYNEGRLFVNRHCPGEPINRQ
jgi:hypothetical protein